MNLFVQHPRQLRGSWRAVIAGRDTGTFAFPKGFGTGCFSQRRFGERIKKSLIPQGFNRIKAGSFFGGVKA